MPRVRRILWLLMIGVINLALVAIIAGLLIATALPAYVDRHQNLKIGESVAK